MHEASIAKGILETALAALPQGQRRITAIRVVAGVFAGVERESLELYFQELSQGTAAQGAKLEVTHPPAHLVCTACGHSVCYSNEGDLPVNCAQCGASNKLEGGSELYLDTMEVEEE